MKTWKNKPCSVTFDVETDEYELELLLSGHDYPARITSDPDTSEPADYEMDYEAVAGYKNDVKMSKIALADFCEEYDELILESIEEQI